VLVVAVLFGPNRCYAEATGYGCRLLFRSRAWELVRISRGGGRAGLSMLFWDLNVARWGRLVGAAGCARNQEVSVDGAGGGFY